MEHNIQSFKETFYVVEPGKILETWVSTDPARCACKLWAH